MRCTQKYQTGATCYRVKCFGGGEASTFHLFYLFFVRFTLFKCQAAMKGSLTQVTSLPISGPQLLLRLCSDQHRLIFQEPFSGCLLVCLLGCHPIILEGGAQSFSEYKLTGGPHCSQLVPKPNSVGLLSSQGHLRGKRRRD